MVIFSSKSMKLNTVRTMILKQSDWSENGQIFFVQVCVSKCHFFDELEITNTL